jgi:predicted Rossmann fold nucleotide-binding protein DprA/Smf involved in DNA uptake
VEIIARAKSRPLQAPDLDIRPAVLETIHRRPCTLEDLTATLGADPKDLVSLLNDLATSGKIEKIQETRGVFYRTVK